MYSIKPLTCWCCLVFVSIWNSNLCLLNTFFILLVNLPEWFFIRYQLLKIDRSQLLNLTLYYHSWTEKIKMLISKYPLSKLWKISFWKTYVALWNNRGPLTREWSRQKCMWLSWKKCIIVSQEQFESIANKVNSHKFADFCISFQCSLRWSPHANLCKPKTICTTVSPFNVQ